MTKYQRLLEFAETLRKEGERILSALGRTGKQTPSPLPTDYHRWYHQAVAFLGEVSADAKRDFVRLYEGLSRSSIRQDPPIATALSDLTDAVLRAAFEQKLQSQIGILQAVPRMVEVRAFGLRQILSADLLADEMVGARELLTAGHTRAAGAVGAAILERHLKQMCGRYGVGLAERETVGTLNVKLQDKYADPSDYRKVQWLNDLRSQCVHVKDSEPTPEKVEEFLDGVAKFVSTA
ncbi:MAG: hypothetical protein L0338_24525 [Acidobacteria bacterium]|nr:hypothetical protein [Acidobacteriota bacterium]